ncbi:GumC family protein [Microvirga massiliensis]|uniref:GumC family protein n=1 Tax=Microvirga massiliensis TaxID=1033741 RepID=UPI000660288F|nr:polysaccharide biosynthesis tyrosine autokinase [Microvirga massiliensis]
MLYQIQGGKFDTGQESAASRTEKDYIGLRDIYAFLVRHFWTIAFCTAVATAIGVTHVLTAEPLFSAQARLVIDPGAAQAFREQSGVFDASLDNAKVDSQIEFLRSESVAMSVIRELSLVDDPEFRQPGGSWPILPGLFARKEQPAAPSDYEQLRNAIAIFSRNLAVRRVGQSYVIEVAFTSVDPDKAARIANATADAYIADQLESKAQAARNGGQWLEVRIEHLRKQLSTAARAAQEFRAQNNIVDAGNRGLLDDQQLAELNSQLVLARARTAETQARLERIEDILASGIPDAAVTEVLGNQVMSSLRERYINASNKLAELGSRYPENHPAVMQLSNEMQEYKKAIAEELRRIGQVYRSDAEVSKVRESELKDQLAKLVQYAAMTKEKQIEAAELDTVAQTYRRLFESYLQTLAEAVQRESFPITNARVISTATRPLARSFPKTKLIIAFSTLAGALVGLGVAVVAHNVDRTIRLPRQVRRELNVSCLGLVPWLGGRGSRAIAKARRLFDRQSSASSGDHLPTEFREVEEHPFSRFSHAMRALKTSIDTAGHLRQGRCIAVTSLAPKEGKTTIAANLARLFALAGSKTLLVDGDLRKPRKRGAAVAQTGRGLLDALASAALLQEVVIADERIPLHILAAANEAPLPNSSDYLGSDQMRQMLEHAREIYQTIIIDLPAMRAAPDARAISPLIDSFIVVSEWGQTPIDNLRDALDDIAATQANVLGVLINKVDVGAVRRLGESGATYYIQ